MSATRSRALALGCGLVHVGVVLGVALHLGYDVGPGAYSLLGAAWRYGGLALVAAVPVYAWHRYRLVLPVLALLVTAGAVLWLELTPPGPTFRDLSEVERLAEPTGIVVVEDGLYAVRYMTSATAWTVGFLFLGGVEYVARASWQPLPPSRSVPWLSVPVSRPRGVLTAATAGLLHAVAMGWLAVRLGVGVSASPDWLVVLYAGIGLWLVATTPIYLLVRHRLVAPATLLALAALFDVRAELTGGVEGPHALYVGAWVVVLAVVLVVAGAEYALRRLGGGRVTPVGD
ncbi:MAG: hypothetical protein ABEJ43_03060 [Haloferacaceae archaeon]